MDIQSYFDDRTGSFQCKKRGCLTCQFNRHGQSSFKDRAGNTFYINQCITCSSEYVIYMLTCPCNLSYVGCTKCTLRKWIGGRCRFISDGSDIHSVPRHFKTYHNKNIKALSVCTIECIPKGSLPMRVTPYCAGEKPFGYINCSL